MLEKIQNTATTVFIVLITLVFITSLIAIPTEIYRLNNSPYKIHASDCSYTVDEIVEQKDGCITYKYNGKTAQTCGNYVVVKNK